MIIRQVVKKNNNATQANRKLLLLSHVLALTKLELKTVPQQTFTQQSVSYYSTML